jgi:hypothetical protein
MMIRHHRNPNASTTPKLYREAAEQGLVAAIYNIGLKFQEGLGVEKNAQEALAHYRKAATNAWACCSFLRPARKGFRTIVVHVELWC